MWATACASESSARWPRTTSSICSSCSRRCRPKRPPRRQQLREHLPPHLARLWWPTDRRRRPAWLPQPQCPRQPTEFWPLPRKHKTITSIITAAAPAPAAALAIIIIITSITTTTAAAAMGMAAITQIAAARITVPAITTMAARRRLPCHPRLPLQVRRQ